MFSTGRERQIPLLLLPDGRAERNVAALIYNGKFKNKFKHGTIKGTFKMSGTLIPPPMSTTFTMTGKFKITGGTRKLRKAHGKGTMTCTSTDLTQHFTCTQVLTKGKL